MNIETTRGIPHALFWRLHTSYLKNNRYDAEKFLGMLSDYSENTILAEITAIHFNRFLKIKDNIQKGIFGRIYESGFSTPMLEAGKKQPSCQELEFVNKLCTDEGRAKLCTLCELSPKTNFQREYELNEYGRLDLLGKEGRRLVAIEVKVGQAPNSVVSQIDRYRLALELNFCIGIYDTVDAYVLAESFTTYDAIELSRLSVKMIEHKGMIESMRLL